MRFAHLFETEFATSTHFPKDRNPAIDMLFALLLSSFLVSSALAGSACPPREDIYPCSCVATPVTKKLFFTAVTCHKLSNTEAFSRILPSLKSITIDHFYLYDSFWEANKLGTSEGENNQVLPTDWMTVLKIKEMEIVDTTLSSCFACSSRMNCRNTVTTRFTAVNSSNHEKICTLCTTGSGSKFSWTSCMSKMRQFHFRYGKLSVIRTDLFPLAMRDLTEVDLSHNQISKVESMAFKNVPRLKILNLSHNAVEKLDAMFTANTMPSLETLDLSWNFIKELGPNFFPALQKLKFLKLNNNEIIDLKANDWKSMNNDVLRNIDITENPINCDCTILWVNATLHINTVLEGNCATPEDYENSAIRRASRLLSTRCDEDGNIGTRKKTKSTTPSF